jgi:hypothetical protein
MRMRSNPVWAREFASRGIRREMRVTGLADGIRRHVFGLRLVSLAAGRIVGAHLLAAAMALTALAAVAGDSRAVLLTPRTEPGKFTIGATELWFHRDTKWADGYGESEDDFNLGAFWAKYGFHRRVTVFAEFVVLNGDPHRQGRSYRHINLGVGANVLFVEFEDFYAGGLVNYFENFQHDNQSTACHSTTRHWAVLVQVGRVFPLGPRHELDAWWGPSYIRDEQVFDGGGCGNVLKESLNDLGFSAGLDFLLWEHFECFTHVVFARYFQPRLGIGYRF